MTSATGVRRVTAICRDCECPTLNLKQHNNKTKNNSRNCFHISHWFIHSDLWPLNWLIPVLSASADKRRFTKYGRLQQQHKHLRSPSLQSDGNCCPRQAGRLNEQMKSTSTVSIQLYSLCAFLWNATATMDIKIEMSVQQYIHFYFWHKLVALIILCTDKHARSKHTNG